MTNEQAARYSVDANARLHRPDGTFASKAEVEAVERCAYALRIELADAIAEMQAKATRKAARRFFAPETKSAKPVLPEWKALTEHKRRVALWLA